VERQHYLPNEDLDFPFELDSDEPDYIPDDDLEELVRAFVYTLRTVGGTLVCAADRAEIGPGVWVNRGFAVKWNSYAPGERQPKPKPNREERRRQRPRDQKREERRQSVQERVVAEASPPQDDEDEGLEPDGGTVVDQAEADPDNAGVRPDYENDPADVFSGSA
jgi:hypothetical protein